MFRKSLMALAIASLTAASAWAAVSADEAKQLGTTLTPIGAEKAGNKDGTIPEYTGGSDAAGGLQGRQRLPPRSVRQREAAPGDHRQGHGGAGRQADRGHQGAAQALSDHARRRLPDAPHRRAAAAGARQHGRRTPPARRAIDGGLGAENVLRRHTRSRSRRPATKRCGTTCCATTAWATTASSTTTGTSTRRACRARHRAVNVLGVADLRSEEDGPIGATDPYWLVKLYYVGPPRRAGEGLRHRTRSIR